MELNSYVFLVFTALINNLLRVEAGLLALEEDDSAVISKNFGLVRHKRNSPSDSNKGDGCCQNKATDKSQQTIIVKHYHYYYCCPDIVDQVHANPKLAEAIGLNANQYAGDCNSVSCSCTVTGTCSCSVGAGGQQHQVGAGGSPGGQQNQVGAGGSPGGQHNQVGAGGSPGGQQNQVGAGEVGTGGSPGGQQNQVGAGGQQNKAGTGGSPGQRRNRNNVEFGFAMFSDPVSKNFFDFITKNFVKKDPAQSENVCQKKTDLFDFQDPICKEFLSFFSDNFMRRSKKAPPPTQTPTVAPTQGAHNQQQGNANNFNHELGEIKNIFGALNRELKNTLSETVNLANIVEEKFKQP